MDPSLGFNACIRAELDEGAIRRGGLALAISATERDPTFRSEISAASRRQAASNASLRGWDAPWSATSIGTPRAFALWIADPTSPPWKGDDISRALLRRGE